jgi:hypothetical protein
MIGNWKSQSDSQQIHETKNCEMQFRFKLWSPPVVTWEEGASLAKLLFGVSEIATWRVEIPCNMNL